MKVYPSTHVRNVAVMSHQGAGKTSLTESMIFDTGATSRLGKVSDGNTVSDYHPEEIKRQISVNTSLVACEWKDHKINLLDVPGFADFFGETESSIRVADSILMILDSVAGVEVRTEIIWDLADENNTPCMAFINKMDRENADFEKALDSMQTKLTRQIVPVQLPIGKEAGFKGIIDLIEEKAYEYGADGKAKPVAIPAELADDVEHYREMMIEAAAEGEDEITMKFLDGEELTKEEIVLGLKEGIKQAKVVPVLCGSSLKNIGADLLMDFIVNYMPDPLANIPVENANKPVAALVFKTLADSYVGKLSLFKVFQGSMKGDSVLYNATKEMDEKVSQLNTSQGKNQIPLTEVNLGDIGVVAKLANATTGDTLTTKDSDVIIEPILFSEPALTIAIAPKSKGDEDKLGNAIARLLEEDPTLHYQKDVVTRQTTLTGMGETHIDIIIERLKRKFGVDVETVELKIPYRETIRGSIKHVEGKHKKQSGGHGQFGHVFIDMEPYADADYLFEEKIFGGSVPKQYIPAVEKGLKESMQEGILAGFPVSNIKVTLVDGSYHAVDSSEMAFKIATNLAFKKACEQAKPTLLEPVMEVEIIVPDQYMGDIMGDMNSTRRGKIMGMEKQGKMQVIKAQAPLQEMARYSIDLRSITQGRGRFTMKYSHYEEVPQNITEKVVAQVKLGKGTE
jgi:elongation factor G